MSFAALSANAMVLILAGSETTATLLSGSIYLLLIHSDKMERLQREIRSAYKSDDEINITNVNNLPYLLAVLNEALRLYPPVTSNLIREVPSGGREIGEFFVPGGVSLFRLLITTRFCFVTDAAHSWLTRLVLNASHGL